ncbi:ATP synthase F1 subunit epsilon [Phototrophicus methaneseepsis]|uniref:ATP synthase epsilon chain n=1 Tax=Phototrophicus methaneseepsis TaxID=2710758 RepID=A0A7S8E6W0_9CHLR|nr:ATP synthase F1 subunit epsilon [Phototrophicus methaneseepsis]QPC81471.1 ATP synthase F1 subunit epsilon [Phototrophicus methaneseepsis]
MPIHVELVSRERKVFEEPEADIVVLPAMEGEMGVLPNHAPILTPLTFGEMVVRKGNAEERFAIYGGVVDVRPDKVVVLADTAESSYSIDAEKAEEARRRAQSLLDEGLPPEQNRDAVLALRRAEFALKVSRNMQSRGGSRLRIIMDENGNGS